MAGHGSGRVYTPRFGFQEDLAFTSPERRPIAGHAGRAVIGLWPMRNIVPGRGPIVYDSPSYAPPPTLDFGEDLGLDMLLAVIENGTSNYGPNQPLADWEIGRFTLTRTFETAETDEESKKNSCSICLDDFVDGDTCGRLQCTHVFHQRCLENWLKTKPTCPHCRFNVRIASASH